MNSIKAIYKGKAYFIQGWTDNGKTHVYGVDADNKPFKIARTRFPRVLTVSISRIHRGNSRLNMKAEKSEETKLVAENYTYGIPELKSEIQGCVYRLFYGDYFVIIKGKYLRNSLEIMQRNYIYFHLNEHKENDSLKNSHYFKFYQYCSKNHGKFKYRVEVELQSDDPLKLLTAEQELLLLYMRNKKCMNNSIVAYLPKWIPEEIVQKFKEIYKDTVKI